MRRSRFTPAAIVLHAVALACSGAQAADVGSRQGLLFQAEAGGHRMMVCIQNREGRFYTVAAPDAQDAFLSLHTRYMARPEGDAASDALSGVWQIGQQDSFDLSEPRSGDSSIDRMTLKASGPNRWRVRCTITIHLRAKAEMGRHAHHPDANRQRLRRL
jgi:hypothetical protein